MNEFTVPGAATKQGRRQEPCTPGRIAAEFTEWTAASLTPSSFDRRLGRGRQQNPPSVQVQLKEALQSRNQVDQTLCAVSDKQFRSPHTGCYGAMHRSAMAL
jgi:hypothetical protein